MPTVKFKVNPNNLVPNTPKQKKNSVTTTKKIIQPVTRIQIIPKKYNPSSLIKLQNSLILLEGQITKKNKMLLAFKESEFTKPKRKLQSRLAQYRVLLKAIKLILKLNHDDCR